MTAGTGESAGKIFTTMLNRARSTREAPGQDVDWTTAEDGIPAEAAGALAKAHATYVADLQGNITSANQHYRGLAKIIDSSAPGGQISPEPIFPLEKVISRVITDGESRKHLDFLKTPGGTRHFVSNHFPLYDGQGKISAVCGMYEDNTLDVAGRKNAVTAKERFDDIARLHSGWIWETDVDFRLDYLSPQVSVMLGRHPRELLGQELLSIGHLDDSNLPEDEKNFAPSTRSAFRDVAFSIVLPDGAHRRFHISGVPKFDEDGTFCGYRGTATDITRIAEMRRVASLSQKQLTTAIENISEGFALYDPAGELILINNRFGEFFGEVPNISSPGTPFSSIFQKAADQGLFKDKDEALETCLALWPRTKALGEASAEVQINDGRWFRLSGRSTEENGIVTIISDVTEMKSREEVLKASRDLAEQASRSKSLFLANMSHELRTPLNAIIGFSEIMHDETLGPIGNPRYQEYVGDIIDSSRHLLSVINDILEVSKAEAGKIELYEENLLVDNEIKAAVRLFVKQAAAEGIELKIEEMDQPCRFRADQRKFRQILLNLISNAIKFTPSGGTVTITPALRKNGELTVTVEDTGIGMEEEDIPAALTAFGQVESTLSRRFEGTGLGLPLTRALVEVHGGHLRIDSTPGIGTRVRISLPKERVLGNAP